MVGRATDDEYGQLMGGAICEGLGPLTEIDGSGYAWE